MKNDIDIYYDHKMKDITEILKKYNVPSKYIFNYGNYKAKISIDYLKELDKKNAKLILVTSINPTPYGEGKTTLSIGLCDALNKLNKKAIVTLREPSMGPVFGIKGGACGGGYSQVVPMEDINLHFTGDIHAITSANNLLCAIVDNHIYQGNKLDIKRVVVKRCLDINDRALRKVILKTNNEREEEFVITVATELMAILCLAKNFIDLKRRINNMIVGYNSLNKPIFVSDLGCCDALSIILKDAINPNVVQTLEGNLALIHGGPFANIAHGCNSIIATKMALNMASYVITEAGFGAELGAEKFLDITSLKGGFNPSLIVINATIRSIKHNGGCSNKLLNNEGIEYLEKGLCNLVSHINNMLLYTSNVLVVINKFKSDKPSEINYIVNAMKKMKISCEIANTYGLGSDGGIDFAKKVIEMTKKDHPITRLYDINDSIKDKISIISKKIYHAKDIIYSDDANKSIEEITKLGLSKYSVCIAKTQYSFSDNKDLLGDPRDYDIHVRDVYVLNGAELIVVLMGNILTMPGLGANSSYINMKISDDRKISGLF